MKLVTVFNREELTALQTPIIIEMWSKVMTTGSGKRKLNNEFTPDEIESIRRLYNTFHSWHFKKVGGTGIPANHAMTIKDYELTKRAVHFFATI